MLITPQQCRAARALLDITRAQLASAANVAERTLASFEQGDRTPRPDNLAAIRRALEGAGVSFTETGVEMKREAT
jgi:transcriptional regulator with XRE-family HTH domain